MAIRKTAQKGLPMRVRDVDSSHPSALAAARRRWRPLAAMGLLALSLAGCSTAATETTSSTLPADYRLRHPIGLVNAPTDLDIFVGRNAGSLDSRQADDIRRFAQDFRRDGRGPMLLMVPSHKPGLPVANHRGVQAVRSELAANGVSGGMVQVTTYESPGDPMGAPVRLTFAKLQAKVMTRCGEWPADVAGNAASLEGWENRSYHNFGCAYQTAIANQVDDPVDLVRPRQEARADVQRRMKVFDDARKSIDPSTAWKTGSASVSGGGGSSGGGN
jgi:pilus assembly protein CpaD